MTVQSDLRMDCADCEKMIQNISRIRDTSIDSIHFLGYTEIVFRYKQNLTYFCKLLFYNELQKYVRFLYFAENTHFFISQNTRGRIL